MTPLISIAGWFFIVLVVLVIGIIAIGKFTYRTGKKGIDKVKERRNK